MVAAIAKQLVDTPDEVSASLRDGQRGETIELRVSPDEVGQVIGRSGRVARALRTLTAATGGPGERPSLDILD